MQRFPAIFLLGLLLLSTCAAKKEGSQVELIGGDYAKAGEFGFVVRINQHCSATRIGLYEYLTAAHCLIDTDSGRLMFQYAFGEKVLIENVKSMADGSEYESSVFYVDIHPSFDYRKKLSELRLLDTDNIDMAILVISDSLPLETVPFISFSPLALKNQDAVLLTGYGCESIPQQEGGGKLKIADQKIAHVSKTHYFTKNDTGKNDVQLCPGDLGGPLLVKASGAYILRGVNQGVEFSENIKFNHLLYSSFTRADGISWLADPNRPNPYKVKPKDFVCTATETKVLYKGLPAQTKVVAHSFSTPGLVLAEKIYFSKDAKLEFSISNDPELQHQSLTFTTINSDTSPYEEFDGSILRGIMRLARDLQDKDYHLEIIIYDKSDASKIDSIHLYLTNCR